MALVASPATHAFLNSPQRSFASSDQAYDGSEDIWGDLRRIFIDVGSTLAQQEELDHIAAAEEAVINKDTEREEIVSKLEGEVRILQKQLAAASASAQRPASVPSPLEHNEQMRQLEQQHYATGKALNEEQAGLGKREIELGRCRVEREEVGSWLVGEEEGCDSKAIRLRLLNDIGFRLMSGTDTGSPRLVIRNDAKDDVHTATIDKTRSRTQWANLVWNLASD